MTQINLPTYEQQQEILNIVQNIDNDGFLPGAAINQSFRTTSLTLIELYNIKGKGIITGISFVGSSGTYAGGQVQIVLDGEITTFEGGPSALSNTNIFRIMPFYDSLVLKATKGSSNNGSMAVQISGVLL